MLAVHILHDKEIIYQFLRKNIGLHLYAIGDLDDFFWSRTSWFALMENQDIKIIALLYTGMNIPTLQILYEGDSFYAEILVKEILQILPRKFYGLLSTGLLGLMSKQFEIEYYGKYYKMELKKLVPELNDLHIHPLTIGDILEIQEFFKTAYPHNWFDSRMLETNKYLGYYMDDRLAGVSGIHVYSREYRVAGLGNIATHPEYRGQGIGFTLTSVLCQNLQKEVDVIGLNVRSDNAFAIKCYNSIGFDIIATFDECLVKSY